MNRFLFILALSLPAARAEDGETARRFGSRLRAETVALYPGSRPEHLRTLHFAGEPRLWRAMESGTLDAALGLMRGIGLSALAEAQSEARPAPPPALGGRRLTVVVVPGVFAEFIQTRAFEELFERASPERDAFRRLVAAAAAKGDPDASDPVLFLRNLDNSKPRESLATATPLDELLHLTELELHGARLRLVLLGTPFSSLESLGDAAERAATFNRRLEKFLALTGPDQPLAFVGYSRGTVLGLEMLSRARREGKGWLRQVKAMISLGGVALGSTLADDATRGERSATRKILGSLRATGLSLEKYAEGMGVAERTRLRLRNDARWAKFLQEARPLLQELSQGEPLDELLALTRVDPRAPVGIVARMWKELGLTRFWSDYNRNIDRFNHFVEQLLLSVQELSTESRLAWYRANKLPLHLRYYSITAAMADPGANELEKVLFESPLAYGSGSQDDRMLTQNRKDYEKLSGGLALNDSQVSVLQASLPAGLLGGLNPGLRALDFRFLGVCSTHHWGLALREVNRMRGGQRNGFPREALLRALAVQVLEDER